MTTLTPYPITLWCPPAPPPPQQFAKDVVAKVVQELGRLDVLVNNASEQHVRHELTDITPEQLTQTFKTNVFGYFYFAQVWQSAAAGCWWWWARHAVVLVAGLCTWLTSLLHALQPQHRATEVGGSAQPRGIASTVGCLVTASTSQPGVVICCAVAALWGVLCSPGCCSPPEGGCKHHQHLLSDRIQGLTIPAGLQQHQGRTGGTHSMLRGVCCCQPCCCG